MSAVGSHYVLNPAGQPIGHLHIKRTDAERDAGVTPTNEQNAEGHLYRYGTNTVPGTTDMTSAVANWLSVGAQGVPLYLPSEIVLCSSWTEYVATSDIKIYTTGPGAVLKGSASVDFIRPAGGDIIVDGVEFNTWRQVFENDTGDSGTTDRFELTSCRFISCTQVIDHERPINRLFFDKLYFNTITGYAIRIGENTYANQDNWKDMEFSNIRIDDATATGTSSAYGMLVYGQKAQFTNINIGTITGANSGATIAGLYTKVRYLTINGVIVESVTKTGTATDITAVTVKGSLRSDTANGVQGFSSVINNVNIKSSARLGFRIQNGGYVLATNIVVDDADVDCITIDDPDAQNIVLNGFSVRSDTLTGTVGVRVSTDSRNIKVLNGVVDGPAIGVRLDSPTDGTAEGIEVGHVDGTNCATAVVQINTGQNMDRIRIHNINCDENCARGLSTTGAGTVTGLEVYDCDFSEATTAGVSLGGSLTSPKLRRVRGYVTENAGLATVSSGGTISHGLAATPDCITVTAGETGLTDFTVSSVGATTFVVTFGGGGGSDSVYWRASMDEAL